MKLQNFLLFFLSALFLSSNLSAQIQEGAIYYQNSSVIGYGWKEKLAAYQDTAQSPEQQAKLQQIKRQLEAFDTRHTSLDTNTIDLSCYFSHNQVRYLRKGERADGVFRIYDLDKLENYRYRIRNEKAQIDTTLWNFRVNPDWRVRYDVKEDRDDRKIILGLDCYKVVVDQYQEVNEKRSHVRFELYISEKLHFPPHLICGWYDRVLEYGALEVKSWDMDEPRNYSIIKAVQLDRQLDMSFLEVPAPWR